MKIEKVLNNNVIQALDNMMNTLSMDEGTRLSKEGRKPCR